MMMMRKNNIKDKTDNPIEMQDTPDIHYDEEKEAFQDWPSDTNVSTDVSRTSASASNKMDAPISKISHSKPMLIGNVDEDKLVKKANLMKEDENPLFDDIQPNLLTNPKLKIKKNETAANKKMKLDDNLGMDSADGWLDDAEIKF
jgi:hypothetical protein